jgi:hypothetical protein
MRLRGAVVHVDAVASVHGEGVGSGGQRFSSKGTEVRRIEADVRRPELPPSLGSFGGLAVALAQADSSGIVSPKLKLGPTYDYCSPS